MKDSVLQLIDRTTHRPLNNGIPVEGMTNPSDMLVMGSDIYIAECNPDDPAVLKISTSLVNCEPTSDRVTPERVIIPDILNNNSLIPFAFSLSKNKQNLIITCRYQEQLYAENDKFVLIYNFTSRVTNKLKLPENIEDPQHVIEDPLNTGHYVLLHRPSMDNPAHSLYKLNVAGDRLIVIDQNDGYEYNPGINDFLDGGYLASCDDGSGSIVAVGWTRDTVLKITNNLSSYEQLLERQTHWPCRIINCSETKSFLIVMPNDIMEYPRA